MAHFLSRPTFGPPLRIQKEFVKANAENAEQSQYISSSSPVLSQLQVSLDSRSPGHLTYLLPELQKIRFLTSSPN